MKLSQFKLRVPDSQIAQFPLYDKDATRLMVVHRSKGVIEHQTMRSAVDYFDEGDVMIFNNAKVYPARLQSQKEKTLAHIEIFLLRELNHETRYWDVLVDPARKIRIGNKLFFDEDSRIVAEVIDNTTSRGRTLRFLTDYENEEFVPKLYAVGHTPLPKYIHRPMDEQTEEAFRKEYMIQANEDFEAILKQTDKERYQSVFASEIGAVAVPATSAQFSRALIKRLEIKGVNPELMTSYMSLSNFKSVDVEDLSKHKMESEHFIIPQAVVNAVSRAHESGRKVCAVGSEIMRALEHVVGTNGQISAQDAWTNKFIFPPYDFSVANAFFTNLYFSQSTQLMMAMAFGGYELMMEAYNEAIEAGYRFGDYGDAMLIID